MRNLLKEDWVQVLLDMANVEGQEIFSCPNHDCGLAWALDQYKDDGYSLKSALRALHQGFLNRHNRFVVYGSGGLNRWVVTHEGDVLFSQRHSLCAASDRLAEKLGFGVV